LDDMGEENETDEEDNLEAELDSDLESESADVAEVGAGEDERLKGVAGVLNYIFQGEDCECMSAYEIGLQTRVAQATEGQMSRYTESISTESSSSRQGRP
jgi:hypothetical protein